jgi:hypothetical protein
MAKNEVLFSFFGLLRRLCATPSAAVELRLHFSAHRLLTCESFIQLK